MPTDGPLTLVWTPVTNKRFFTELAPGECFYFRSFKSFEIKEDEKILNEELKKIKDDGSFIKISKHDTNSVVFKVECFSLSNKQ